MIVLGIDSAELTGFAVINRGPDGRETLIDRGVWSIHSGADIQAAAAHMMAAATPDVVAIEEPFVHPRNPLTGLVLARLLGRWLQVFESLGFTTVTIPASMWQTSGLLPGVTNRTRSPDRKAAAREFARNYFGIDATEDEADAIALAVYVARNATRRAA